MHDYEIDEIRRIRHEISNENHHNLKEVSEYYKKIEDELRNKGQYKFVNIQGGQDRLGAQQSI